MRLRIVPDPILGKSLRHVVTFDSSLRKLVNDMIKVMIDNHGIGLAANQIGVDKRVIICKGISSNFAMINPEYLTFSSIGDYQIEGCLSLPGRKFRVWREKSVEAKYLDLDGKPHKIKLEGIYAQVFQHEMDHIRGRTIADIGEEVTEV